jgi:hypothetical protein
MKMRNYLSHGLLCAALFFFASCQKEIKPLVLPNDDAFTDAEMISIPVAEVTTDALIRQSSINDCNEDDQKTFYGPTVQMGNGHLRSWINIAEHGNKPLAIGIEFTAKAFQNLPTDPSNFAANTFILPLHQKAKSITPFEHIMVNWEPNGHEPPGIYTVPHFDTHFYKITSAERMTITGAPTAPPAAGYLPASYFVNAGAVPQMGTHWVDPTSPEFPPTSAPFTHTFIYGSNNGKVVFNEPMITRAFLLSGTMVNKAFAQPLLFSPTGTNYPIMYKIWKNSDKNRHYVALTNFVLR